MPRYKRTRDEAELDIPVEPTIPPQDRETLTKLRNTWEFASFMQYVFLFGHVVKIDDDFDIEDLEAECLKQIPSDRLPQLGLQLLKYVSSHRGLTLEIFEEYTRRQYYAKAPQRNPFGDDEEPMKFNDLDVFTRIKVLHQLSTWTLGNADRIRGLMPQDEDHLDWRIDPLGWDKDDRSYYVLDDNRLYRRSDEPVPPPTPRPKAKPKSKSVKRAPKRATRGTRASKRIKVDESEEEEVEEPEELDETNIDDTAMTTGEDGKSEQEPGFGFTSKTWECIAITLEEYQEFMASIFRSRDPNEKQLRARIEEDVLPIIEKRAEAIRQKKLKKLRELENVQKMATAKRSGRLASKAEREAKEQEERDAEERKRQDLKMAHEEQERQKRIEEGHESRRLTREQRVREREAKRILHEEELAKLEEEAERAESQGGNVEAESDETIRASGRQRQTQREQHKKELEKLTEEDGNWYFDCSVCGQHGENMDDGSHSIACDRCSVWQHSKCHGFSPKQAEQDDFIFICSTCKRKEEDAKKPKIPPLKLHGRSSASASPEVSRSRPSTSQSNALPPNIARQLDAFEKQVPSQSPGPFGQIINGPSLSPHGQGQGPPGYRYPPVGNFAIRAPQQPQQYLQNSPPPSYGQAPPNEHRYSPPSHRQQHQYAHQSAVSNAGGHAGYYQQPPPQNAQNIGNGHSSLNHQQPLQQYQYSVQQQWNQYQPPQQPPQASAGAGSSQLMNGFESPTKAAPKPPLSSPPQQSLHPSRTPQAPSPGNILPHDLQHSPKMNLAPPVQQQPQQSPVKSSPPPALQQQPGAYQQHSPSQQPPPRLAHTPQALPPPNHSFSNQPGQLQTPDMRQSSFNGASPNATHVAADGMSGPWPEGSKAIPQKHDQSPAPPSTAQDIRDKSIFPPATPLAPSHSQQVAAETGSIPVKKMQLSPEAGPEHNGVPHPQREATPPGQDSNEARPDQQ